jgi:hypothetical protein
MTDTEEAPAATAEAPVAAAEAGTSTITVVVTTTTNEAEPVAEDVEMKDVKAEGDAVKTEEPEASNGAVAVEGEKKQEEGKEESAKETPETETKKEEDTKDVNGTDEDTKKDSAEDNDTKKEPLDPQVVQTIKERLQFFFSDANIRQDYFIRRELIRKEGPHPHMLPIEKLLKFNTIKQHSTDPAAIVAAVQELSDVLTLSEDKQAIGRVHEFSMEQMNDNVPLTLHLKNIPYQGACYNVRTDDIRDLFSTYGPITLVKLRLSKDDEDEEERRQHGRARKKKRLPVGAALVEFENKEDLEKAAADTLTEKDGEKLDPPRKLTLKDNTLEVMLLTEYIAQSKKRKAEDEGNNQDGGDGKKYTIDWKPGCVIRLKGLPEGCSREAILETVAKFLGQSVDDVKNDNVYADYSRGDKDGAIRFATPSDSIKALSDKLKEGFEISGGKVEDAIVLEGEDEAKYWKDHIDFKNKQMSNYKQRKQGGGGRKKGRRY